MTEACKKIIKVLLFNSYVFLVYLKWVEIRAFLAELSRAKRARTGGPWVRKFGYDVAYARPPTRTHTSCKPMSNVTIDLAQLD